MSDAEPAPEWLETANRLATVAHQLVTVVHETNNLLQVISGNAEILEISGELSERSVARARAIVEHARRASMLLAEVLRFSRDPSVAATRLDAVATVRDAMTMRHYSAAKARIAVTLRSPAEAWVVANRRRTLQILVNLLMNAEQALLGREDARIDIGITHDEDVVVMTVADNGRTVAVPSVAPASAAAAAERRTPAVLGIGLAVAAWLAREQRGTLRVDARPGGGVVAAVTLPAAVDG